jgi:4-hydroxyphenylpyruvate dioxygenase-like putative hemolysin
MDQNDITPLSTANLLGIEFIEIVAPSLESVTPLMTELGFRLYAKHRRKNVFLFQQNQLKIIINCSQDPTLEAYVGEMGIALFAIAFKCDDASTAHAELIKRGAWDSSNHSGPMEVNIPGIEAMGGTLIYLVDQVRDDLSVYEIDFKTIPSVAEKLNGSLSHFHEFTIQVDPDRTQTCLTFFERLFGFQAKDEASLQLPGKHAISLRFVEASDEQHNTEFFSKITFKANENSPLRHQIFAGNDRAFAIEVI